MAKYAAYGAKLQTTEDSGTTWDDIAALRDIGGPTLSADTVDVSTHDSTDAFREKLKTLIDGGEVTFDLVFDPENQTSHKRIRDAMYARTSRDYRLVFATTNSKTWSFTAFVTGFDPSNPVEGEISAAVTMTVTGKPNLSAA